MLYWLLAPIFWILLLPACLFNPKIRHHWLTENSSWKSAEKKINKAENMKTIVLFHAASSGEFEQLQPVLEQVDRNRFFIIQSFFSPTRSRHRPGQSPAAPFAPRNQQGIDRPEED